MTDKTNQPAAVGSVELHVLSDPKGPPGSMSGYTAFSDVFPNMEAANAKMRQFEREGFTGDDGRTVPPNRLGFIIWPVPTRADGE